MTDATIGGALIGQKFTLTAGYVGNPCYKKGSPVSSASLRQCWDAKGNKLYGWFIPIGEKENYKKWFPASSFIYTNPNDSIIIRFSHKPMESYPRSLEVEPSKPRITNKTLLAKK